MTFSFSYPKSGLIAVRTKAEISSFPSFAVHEADESTASHSPSLPVLPSAGYLVARSRLLQLLSRPFSSVVVIGNTLRRLASVLLLRQSQPPHGLALAQAILNWCGLPITRRSVFSRAQASKQSARGLFERFKVLSCPVVHVQKHEARNDGKITKAFGEFPNV